MALASVSLARSQNYYYKPYVVPEQQIRPVRANPTSPPPSYPTSPYEQTYPAKYDFAWQVLDSYSGNDYAQQESREGKSTTGSYHVALPDGRIQRVTYTVDGYGGYQAEVTYEGAATYPEAKPYVQPPRPSYPVQPYSAASESRPSYVSQPEAKAVEVTAKPEPVQEAQAIVAPVTEAPAPVVVTSLPPSNIRRSDYREMPYFLRDHDLNLVFISGTPIGPLPPW